MKPDHKQGSWNLGLLYLENKEYGTGFTHYAHGFFTGERIVRSYLNKEGKEADFWVGQNLDGKTIVLHGEQGIGDELLFLQFVPEFKKAHPDTRIVLDVHPRLCAAIQRSFPDIQDIFPTRKTSPEWNTVLRVDYKDGIGSLPKWYHASRRKNAGWLKNDAQLAEKYRLWVEGIQKKFGQTGKPIIGVAWTGGRKKTRTDLRSIPLNEWEPILKQDATFISLDYNPGAELQTGSFWKEHGVPVHHWPDVVEDQDYEHTLALAGVCDLVICINTSIVHVRGSMDLPCWTLTPHGHAWRYGKKDRINPFYNSVIQYHQDDGQRWDIVINKVAKDLNRYLHNFKGSDNGTV
jgi:ADP-heptose:LPS heptosyltransferase